MLVAKSTKGITELERATKICMKALQKLLKQVDQKRMNRKECLNSNRKTSTATHTQRVDFKQRKGTGKCFYGSEFPPQFYASFLYS